MAAFPYGFPGMLGRMLRRLAAGAFTVAAFVLAAQSAEQPRWPEGTVDTWQGFERRKFTVEGRTAWVVAPAKAAAGRPWIWTMAFPDAFVERTAGPQLLAKGFHFLHLDVGNTFGSPRALAQLDAFYAAIVKAGLAPRGTLMGLSRGGLAAYRWAVRDPSRVVAIYADAPVCDFKSWPGGRGTGSGSPRDWQALLAAYGFADEAAALAYAHNPVDHLAPLARAGIPLVHVVGDADTVVPVSENTARLEARYRELGGTIVVLHKPGVGHHPHGLDDPAPVVDFILKATAARVP